MARSTWTRASAISWFPSASCSVICCLFLRNGGCTSSTRASSQSLSIRKPLSTITCSYGEHLSRTRFLCDKRMRSPSPKSTAHERKHASWCVPNQHF
uniref:Putative secreted protein n=1 Tax=Ixodes scapularis TaxID=6945 RepID=A0A4D5RB15_IXOSC